MALKRTRCENEKHTERAFKGVVDFGDFLVQIFFTGSTLKTLINTNYR